MIYNEEQKHSFYEICNKLDTHIHALRAFGALLNSSNLSEFSDENLASLGCYQQDKEDGFEVSNHSSGLRWGLEQIVEMWIEKFERILDEGYIYKIDCAEKAINRIDMNIAEDNIVETLRDYINGLNHIIYSTEFSGETIKKAKEIKQKCNEYAERLLSKSEKDPDTKQ